MNYRNQFKTVSTIGAGNHYCGLRILSRNFTNERAAVIPLLELVEAVTAG
ncbi:uncharacterized protein PHALS_00368 [Plasmopara halstedii]|uniref:Uncharacterized protein n=1 Tax=Plasmopara halstedii TaxID=4781 RepID=A0A0P1A6L9_PLAHL|nr:uncharacterized protein PHALS_00368 [Plasmopara halstedii]CEG36048.1 hypothetical protein PHALS_00368 [Plasmopara halstedii]|eukprot:XP_024572417.1 hypothetical protein PHALS_00368 [Plasmopara halstedii]